MRKRILLYTALLAALASPLLSRTATADTPVTIRIGGRSLSAELNESAPARELARRLPVTVRMNRLRDREYYGDPIPGGLSEEGARQQSFEDGDLAYWLRGRSLALFFDKTRDPGLSSPVIVIGRVTAGLDALRELGAVEEMTVERRQ